MIGLTVWIGDFFVLHYYILHLISATLCDGRDFFNNI